MPLLEILITIATPIKNIAVIKNNIPRSTLKVSPICSNNFIIFLSAMGSAKAVAILYVIVIKLILIIGIIEILTITKIPTIPTAFFKTTALPRTVSIESPKALPHYRYETRNRSFSSFSRYTINAAT